MQIKIGPWILADLSSKIHGRRGGGISGAKVFLSWLEVFGSQNNEPQKKGLCQN